MKEALSCSEQQHFARQVSAPDGRLKFDLRRVPGGVLVGRRHSEDLQEVEHSIVFSEQDLFHRYLDLDPLRFRYVPQYVELKRAFDDLLAIDI